MNYQQFKTNFAPGSSVASPEGAFMGECVSYARQYMALVHGFKSGPIGHAAQIPYNRTFLTAYEKVSAPQVGDLIFWGDDAGNWTNEYGHVAIYDGPGMMMNQNYGSSGKVSRNAIFLPGLIGYYRLKEDEVIKDNTNDYYWYGQILPRRVIYEGKGEMTKAEFRKYAVGKDIHSYVSWLFNHERAKRTQAVLDLGRKARDENWDAKMTASGEVDREAVIKYVEKNLK